MYNEKMVVVVKSNGKIIREVGNSVYLPFGSEYSIYLKNLSSKRAVVSITIDGQDVLNGDKIIVDGNDTFELEGFMDNCGLRVRNKFKFIEKTQEISDYRGNRVDDGLIVVKYRFEKKCSVEYHNYVLNDTSIHRRDNYEPTYYNDDMLFSCCNTQYPNNDNGITVPGSESDQTFVQTTTNTLEETEHTIVLQLKGEIKGQQVCKPITTKTKIQCCTCGRKNKTNNRFCGNCGTALF
jgi:hypothetical protein